MILTIGLHVGGGRGGMSSDSPLQTLDAAGAFGGMQFGFNYQMRKTVVGLEADVSTAEVSGNTSGTLGGPAVSGPAT